jgi:hypothetical protein
MLGKGTRGGIAHHEEFETNSSATHFGFCQLKYVQMKLRKMDLIDTIVIV